MGTKAPQEGDTLGKGKVSRRRAPGSQFPTYFMGIFTPVYSELPDSPGYLLRIFHPQGYGYEISVLPSVL